MLAWKGDTWSVVCMCFRDGNDVYTFCTTQFLVYALESRVTFTCLCLVLGGSVPESSQQNNMKSYRINCCWFLVKGNHLRFVKISILRFFFFLVWIFRLLSVNIIWAYKIFVKKELNFKICIWVWQLASQVKRVFDKS